MILFLSHKNTLSLSLSLSLSHSSLCVSVDMEIIRIITTSIIWDHSTMGQNKGLMVSWLCTPLIIANKFKPATAKIGNVSTMKFIIISTEDELFRELHIVDMSEETLPSSKHTHTHTHIYIFLSLSLSLSLYVCVWIWKSSPTSPPPASPGIIIKGDTKHILFV